MLKWFRALEGFTWKLLSFGRSDSEMPPRAEDDTDSRKIHASVTLKKSTKSIRVSLLTQRNIPECVIK